MLVPIRYESTDSLSYQLSAISYQLHWCERSIEHPLRSNFDLFIFEFEIIFGQLLRVADLHLQKLSLQLFD